MQFDCNNNPDSAHTVLQRRCMCFSFALAGRHPAWHVAGTVTFITRDPHGSLPHSTSLLAGAALTLLGSCGAQSDLEVGQAGELEANDCEPKLGQPVFTHSCQHGRLGPFTEVVASADKNLEPPAVNTTQHVFDILLPADTKNEDGFWYVGFNPVRHGQHAVFSGFEGRDVPLSIVQGGSGDGAVSGALHAEPVLDVSECGEMTEVDVYAFDRGAQYTLIIGPTDAQLTRLFFEHLPTFGQEAWEVRCE